jgi:hypothetical protein
VDASIACPDALIDSDRSVVLEEILGVDGNDVVPSTEAGAILDEFEEA